MAEPTKDSRQPSPSGPGPWQFGTAIVFGILIATVAIADLIYGTDGEPVPAAVYFALGSTTLVVVGGREVLRYFGPKT